MQAAIDHLEKNKIFIETSGTDMVTLTVAYKAIEMAIDNQIAEAMEGLQTQLGGLVNEIKEITTEEDD
jgi:hypothetical protein